MKQSSIALAKGDKWVSLSLSLGEDLAVGEIAHIEGDFVSDIKHQSNTCVPYGPKEWGIAVLSGAPYAFRMMNTGHKEIIVHHLKGILDEEDLEAVSIASAIAIVDFLGGDSRSIATGEWRQTRS